MLLPCGLFSRPNYSKGSRKIKKKNTKHIVGWCWFFLYGMIKRKLSTKKKLRFYCYLNPLWWSTYHRWPATPQQQQHLLQESSYLFSLCLCVCVCVWCKSVWVQGEEEQATTNKSESEQLKKEKTKKTGNFLKNVFLFFFILELLWLLAAHLSLLTTISVAVSFWRLRVCTTSSSYYFISIPENGNV